MSEELPIGKRVGVVGIDPVTRYYPIYFTGVLTVEWLRSERLLKVTDVARRRTMHVAVPETCALELNRISRPNVPTDEEILAKRIRTRATELVWGSFGDNLTCGQIRQILASEFGDYAEHVLTNATR